MRLKFWEATPCQIRIVEIEKAVRVPSFDKEIAKSVQTLQSHPGFVYLLAKLRFQHQILQDTLSTQRQTGLREVEFLQSGIAWTKWLEQQLNLSVNLQTEVERPAEDPEIELFKESQRMLEILK